MICKLFLKVFVAIFAVQSVAAFGTIKTRSSSSKPSVAVSSMPIVDRINHAVVATTVIVATSPFAALAEEVDNYEYGAVDAPIGIAWAGGLLAIATALLPVVLQGGEEAFEEMKERDSGNWGSGDTGALDRKRRR